MLRVRIEGDLAALCGGRRLVVSNHDSLIDGALLGLLLPGVATVVISPEAARQPQERLFSRVVTPSP